MNKTTETKPTTEAACPPESATLCDRKTKVIQYFCAAFWCSDGEDNQYPECTIKHCRYRDEIAEDLIDIVGV